MPVPQTSDDAEHLSRQAKVECTVCCSPMSMVYVQNYFHLTRMHSSRMRTTRYLPYWAENTPLDRDPSPLNRDLPPLDRDLLDRK